MTLIELLTAEMIGGFVVSAAIVMLVIAFNDAQRTSDRVNAAQVGRGAMEEIQQQLRSQSCLNPQEFGINGVTSQVGQQSFVFAGDNRMVYFGDVDNLGGQTGVTGSVGFRPQLRYIYVDTSGGPRKTALVDGWRNATNTAIPFNFSVTPATTFDSLAIPSVMDSVPPTTVHAIADGVTNDTASPTAASGPVSPFFTYYDTNNAIITQVAGSIPTPSLGAIDHINVSYKILGLTTKDSTVGATGANTNTDKRTASFDSNIYLRTAPNNCL